MVVACVGGGSNASAFAGFLDDKDVQLIGVEAGGKGVATGKHAASLTAGRPGVYLEPSYLLQDADGQIIDTESVSRGSTIPAWDRNTRCSRTPAGQQYVPAGDEDGPAGRLACSRGSRGSCRP